MKETKEELKILALKERIGIITSQYEEQLADFRADATIAINELNEQLAKLAEENDELKDELDALKRK